MQKFDPLKTEKGTFHVTKEKSIDVDFMHMVGLITLVINLP